MAEKIKCSCRCHKDKSIKHVIPCCDKGFVYFMEEQEMRAHTIATIGEQIISDTKKHACKG